MVNCDIGRIVLRPAAAVEVFDAVAFQGQGVFETLKEIAKQVLTELKAGG